MIHVTLEAVIVAVTNGMPQVLVVTGDGEPRLPSGPLAPEADRTLELAVRRWVGEQTGMELGYVEQLYTFGDEDRLSTGSGHRLLSIAYVALVHQAPPSMNAEWRGWYDFFPWEDQRHGPHTAIEADISAWAGSDPSRTLRARQAFGIAAEGQDRLAWDGVRSLERYELMYEAGLVAESGGHRGVGMAMAADHRRILATAIGRLRGKLTYRPVVFELLPDVFTLLQLQTVVEALAGSTLHKQNFRRLVERGGLVEGTGEATSTGGRPAELFRFRSEVLSERPRPGVGQPWSS